MKLTWDLERRRWKMALRSGDVIVTELDPEVVGLPAAMHEAEELVERISRRRGKDVRVNWSKATSHNQAMGFVGPAVGGAGP